MKTARIYLCDGVAALSELQLSATKVRVLATRARKGWELA